MFGGGFPKKTVARELAMRGPTLIISEFNTSKMCPCGMCELEDVPDAGRPQPLDASRRPRHHIGHRGSINLCCAIQPFAELGRETDRDELASERGASERELASGERASGELASASGSERGASERERAGSERAGASERGASGE